MQIIKSPEKNLINLCRVFHYLNHIYTIAMQFCSYLHHYQPCREWRNYQARIELK